MTNTTISALTKRVNELDWSAISDELDEEGYAVVQSLLSESACQELVRLYDQDTDQDTDQDNDQDDDEPTTTTFRNTVNMARHGFGQGEYKYFAYPLPAAVQVWRTALYPPLAKIANAWSTRLGQSAHWPGTLAEFVKQCGANEQHRPTPLLLRYSTNDYNCLHQDLYGSVYFPLQVIVQLNEPGVDFEGGELVLVEQRPRMQSRAMVVPIDRGSAAIVPVRERPRQGSKRIHRVNLRHGVARVRSGTRNTLGLIFHDAS